MTSVMHCVTLVVMVSKLATHKKTTTSNATLIIMVSKHATQKNQDDELRSSSWF
jgi:hypothetical protein